MKSYYMRGTGLQYNYAKTTYGKTGIMNKNSAKNIAKHIIDGNTITGEEYLISADYNSDGIIKMNDVVKMLNDM